ncbi:MAG: hypothetical protein J7497_17820, partial [Chitinophagaceae bacterium]|nr:hypothetical protein [Chitinophagaceae bacterium]
MRISYGTTGNDNIGDYAYLSTYFTTYGQGLPYQGSGALAVDGLKNPYLQWEETEKISAGIDLGFFNDRVLIGATYSRNISSNQLLPYNLPSITGVLAGSSGFTQNFPATVQNSIWEFTLNTVNIKGKDFTWVSSFNMTISENKVTRFPDIENTGYGAFNSGVIVGQPLSIKYYGHHLGVDPARGFYIRADGKGQPTFAFAGLGTNDISTGINQLISLRSPYWGGISNTVSYKGLSLDFLWQFVRQRGPRYLYYSNSMLSPGSFSNLDYSYGANNQPASVLNRWQKPGDNAPIARFSTDPELSTDLSFRDAYFSWDASFARLKNLSLSWQLPRDWIRSAHFENANIYFSGQNLVTITNYTG